VLPGGTGGSGGGGATVTDIAIPSESGNIPSPPPSTSAGIIPANMAGRSGVTEGGLLAVLMAAVMGVL